MLLNLQQTFKNVLSNDKTAEHCEGVDDAKISPMLTVNSHLDSNLLKLKLRFCPEFYYVFGFSIRMC